MEETAGNTNMTTPDLEGVDEFGLENMPGHLNCFLNVIIQSLWRIDSVRLFMSKYIQTEHFQDKTPKILPFIESFKVISLHTNDIIDIFHQCFRKPKR